MRTRIPGVDGVRCLDGSGRDAGGGWRDLPYCIKGCDFGGGAGDCSFSSLAQCQATASGRDATCASNPYFNAKATLAKLLPTNRNRQSRRKY